jgi:hypothetical protein
MILVRQNNTEAAQRLFSEARAAMKPLPADPRNPFFDGASYEDVIMWFAFKEAGSALNHGTAQKG